MSDFMTLALAGDLRLEEIDDFVDCWHEKPDGVPLSEFLGMTNEEFALWVRAPEMLPHIVEARHNRTNLSPAALKRAGA